MVPTFVTTWVIETIGPFIATPGATTDPYPERFNLAGVIVGSLWSVVLTIIAVAAAGLAVWASIVAGLVGAAIAGTMMAVTG